MQSRFATTSSPRSMASEVASRSPRSWTPIDNSMSLNRTAISSQLMNVYYQQKEIALNMFDEWSHEQKVNFLMSLMPRATYRQLVHVVNWFQDNIPIWCLDFTTVLPRYLSLYIFSFLDTKTLTKASSVCWRWKFITEHDSLWRDRCLQLGWQLPFYPTENEHGSWKKHFAKSYIQLRELGLAVPDLRDPYPVFFSVFRSNHSATTHTRVIHASNTTVPKLRLPRPNDTKETNEDAQTFQTIQEDDLLVSGVFDRTSLILKDRKKLLGEVGVDNTPGSFREALSVENVLEQRIKRLREGWKPPNARTSSSLQYIIEFYSEFNSSLRPSNHPAVLLPFPASYPAWLGQVIPPCSNPRVLFISNQVPAAELLAVAISWSTVETIVYDFNGSTPASLISELKALLGHRMATSIAIVPPLSESCLDCGFPLTGNCYVRPSKVADPNDDARNFFCELGAALLPRESGGDGHIDVFAPLLMHSEGAKLLLQLNALTGIIFHCPQTARADYEYIFSACDWIVTKSSVGLLEQPNFNSSQRTESSVFSFRSVGGRNAQATLKALSETMPPKLYFEQNRLAFWMKSCKLIHRSMGKIRRDLARTFEYRTESCLLDRLIGQIAFEEFQGEEFAYVMSVWPEVSEAIMAAADQRTEKSIKDHDDEKLEWRMTEVQYPIVAIATQLLEQVGFSIRENFRVLKSEKAVQSYKPANYQSKHIQTVSLYLPTGSSEKPPTETGPKNQASDNVAADEKETDGESNEPNKPNTAQETDTDSLLLGDKGQPVLFKDVIGEGETSSAVVSSGKSDDETTKDDYPLDSSSGIRPMEITESNAGGVPVNIERSWILERARIQSDATTMRKHNKASANPAMVYSVLFTETDRRLIAVRDLYNCEARYNKVLTGVENGFVKPLNQAVFHERTILSTNNIKLLFSDLLQLLEISKYVAIVNDAQQGSLRMQMNAASEPFCPSLTQLSISEFMEALGARLTNWVDVDGQISDVILTFVCHRWNIFLSYMNNYPVTLETLDRCCDEQRLFRSFLARNERTLPIRMLSVAEVFILPFDQLAAYNSHFRRISAHTEQAHRDIQGLREARKLMSQYCALVSERAASHTKNSRSNLLERSFRSLELTSVHDDTGSLSSLTTQLPKFDETASDLTLLRDCPFSIDAGSAGERNFVCRQDLILMRPATGRQLPFEMQLFDVIDEIGFFLFSDCLVVAKRRATHRPYVRDADVAFYYANCVATRDVTQTNLPDTKYINNAVEYRSQQYKWLVVFPEQHSKNRFMAAMAPYIESQLAIVSPRRK